MNIRKAVRGIEGGVRILGGRGVNWRYGDEVYSQFF